ncbi:MAG TPA: hypothetical protein VN675_01275 [Burkholderiales bacterium]|nr:hypothetical protein [Burkholderiales bacterium]
MGIQFRAILALAGALVLAGCVGGTTTNIDVADTGSVIGTVRMSVDFGDRPGPRSHLHTSHAVELGLSGATGSDTQNIAAGQQPIVFGGEVFAAPQDVRAEFGFRFAELAYRFRYLSENRGLGIEALAGLAYAQLGLRLTGATKVAAERLDGTGIVVSLGGLLRLWPSGGIQLRGSGFASNTSEGVSSVGRYEIALAQALGRNAAVRVGYAGWDIKSRREDDDFSNSNRSPIRVRFSGPALGLELMF